MLWVLLSQRKLILRIVIFDVIFWKNLLVWLRCLTTSRFSTTRFANASTQILILPSLR